MRRSTFVILAALSGLAGIGVACKGSSSAGTGTASCQALTSCCTNLPATEQVACLTIVGSASDTSCTQALVMYTTSGGCSGVGTGPGGQDAGSGPGHDAGTGPGSGPGRDSGTGPGSGPGTDAGTGPGSGPGTDAGTGPGTDAGTGPGSGDAGTSPECTVPTTSPSGGSCVTLVAANDAGTGIQCNPVTNVPCESGYECDIASDGTNNLGFICYPPPNTATLCQPCGQSVGNYCVGGETCLTTTSTCVHYCCTDADCGSGTCMTGMFAPVTSAIGTCVTP